VKLPRTVPVALLITAPICATLLLPKLWPSFPGGAPFPKAMIAYGLVALLAVGAMAAFGEGRWADFGFRRPQGPWWRLVLYAVVLGTVSGIAVKLSPGVPLDEKLKAMGQSRVPILLLVATVIEELTMRGWLQGFLEPLRTHLVKLGRVSVSVPVLTVALVFGAWHAPTILSDPWTGSIMVVFTTLLGWLAGTGRERTGSLLPAVVIHLGGNVGGVVAGILWMIVHGAPPPQG
jgi:membrane protease YdiL (CAAX protease family)